MPLMTDSLSSLSREVFDSFFGDFVKELKILSDSSVPLMLIKASSHFKVEHLAVRRFSLVLLMEGLGLWSGLVIDFSEVFSMMSTVCVLPSERQ